MKIWKFPLRMSHEQTIAIPANAKILSAQLQHETICIWALVDEDAEKIFKTIVIYGTGTGPKDLNYLKFIDTVQVGNYVWHIFEVI